MDNTERWVNLVRTYRSIETRESVWHFSQRHHVCHHSMMFWICMIDAYGEDDLTLMRSKDFTEAEQRDIILSYNKERCSIA